MDTELVLSLQLALLDSGASIHLPLLLLSLPLLYRVVKPERRPLIRTSMLLYAIALMLIIGAGISDWLHWSDGSRIMRQTGILLSGLVLIRVSLLLLFHGALPRLHIHPPTILEDLIVALGYLLWCMLRLSYMGLDFSSLVATSAVITAVLAFAMQDTLGNILGGVALQLDDSLHVGDWIRVDDVIGRIVDIGWRSTSVETRNWETVVVPNSVLMKGKFMILGRRQGEPEQWRRWVWFQVGYETSPRKVIQVVEDALGKANVANVAARPPPNCIAMDLAESYVRYAVRYWLDDLMPDDPTDSAIRCRIHAALKGAGIAFALPAQTMHMIKEGEKLEARRHTANIRQRIALLRKSGLFACLTEEELQEMAGHLRYAPLIAGDVVTRQGAVAHWLYLLASGRVKVVLEMESGSSQELGSIDANNQDNFFGEMGMLTGEARAATVIAQTDVECYRLDKLGLERIMKGRPEIAEELARYMAERRAELGQARDAADERARERLASHKQKEFLDRIRDFFNLGG